jgi:hypothetical protein
MEGAHVGIPLQANKDWLIVMRARFSDSVNKFGIACMIGYLAPLSPWEKNRLNWYFLGYIPLNHFHHMVFRTNIPTQNIVEKHINLLSIWNILSAAAVPESDGEQGSETTAQNAG